MRAIVIGAGPAGLTAAHALERRGVRTLVVESEPRIGGRLLSQRREGFTLDLGAQFLAGRYPAVRGLCRELGIGDQLHRFRAAFAIASAAEDGGAPRVRRWPPFREFLALMAWLLAHRGEFRLEEPERSLPFDRQSIAELALARWGRDLLEGWFQPFVSGATGAEPEEVSAAGALAYMVLKLSGSYTLRQGMGALAEALAARLSEVCLDCPATEVVVERGRVRGVRVVRGGRPETVDADAVVVATTAPAAARLLRGWSGAAVQTLSQVDYARCIHLVYALERRSLAGRYGLAVARSLGMNVALVTEDVAKCPAYAPEGAGVMHVVTHDRAARALWSRPDREVEFAVAAELEKLGIAVGRPLFTVLHRWHHGLCITSPGRLADRLALQAQAAAVEGLALAGDYLSIPCLEAAVVSGQQAADRLTSGDPIQQWKVPDGKEGIDGR